MAGCYSNMGRRVAGLYGKSNLDRLRIDEVAELTEDLFKVIIKAFQEQDEDKKVDVQHTLNSCPHSLTN